MTVATLAGLVVLVGLVGLGVRPNEAQAHVVRGNVALSDGVYLSLLDLDERVTASAADRAAKKIQRFLVDAGYELATATASVSEAGELFLVVDEGRLERVVLPGQSALKAAAFHVLADIPDDVFNRPQLDRELARLHRDYGLEVARYEVVQTEPAPEPTFAQLAAFADEWVPPRARHRLEVYLTERDLPTGLTVHLYFASPDGLVGGFGYRTSGLIWDEARFELSPVVGLRIQDTFSGGEGRRFVSRLELATRWYSPPILTDVTERLRVVIEPRVALLNRQRLDLGVRSYDQLQVDPGVFVRWEPALDFELELELGAGVFVQRILGVTEEEIPEGEAMLPERRAPTESWRPFLRARGEIELGRRSDLRHGFEAESAMFYTAGRSTYAFDVGYETTFAVGWDLVEIGLEGSTVLGDVPFTRERSVGRFVRALYGNRHYTTLGAGLSTEYQFSVARDLFRVAVFHDGALYRAEDRATGEVRPAVANSFGLGLSGLVIDTFDVAAYAAVGFNSAGSFDKGVSISVSQVF